MVTKVYLLTYLGILFSLGRDSMLLLVAGSTFSCGANVVIMFGSLSVPLFWRLVVSLFWFLGVSCVSSFCIF